jgi:hypothetical protein
MFRLLLVAVLVSALCACSDNASEGSTPARAVVLSGIEHSFEAAALEEAWIETHLPGAELLQQDLIERDGILMDKLTLEMPDGSKRTVYFSLGIEGGND